MATEQDIFEYRKQWGHKSQSEQTYLEQLFEEEAFETNVDEKRMHTNWMGADKHLVHQEQMLGKTMPSMSKDTNMRLHGGIRFKGRGTITFGRSRKT